MYISISGFSFFFFNKWNASRHNNVLSYSSTNKKSGAGRIGDVKILPIRPGRAYRLFYFYLRKKYVQTIIKSIRKPERPSATQQLHIEKK